LLSKELNFCNVEHIKKFSETCKLTIKIVAGKSKNKQSCKRKTFAAVEKSRKPQTLKQRKKQTCEPHFIPLSISQKPLEEN